MRARALIALGCLAGVCGCGYTPKQLGITGPKTQQISLPSHASEATDDALIPDPGQPPAFASPYAPSMLPTVTPTYGQSSRYYGYN